jgi:dTMP kinase
VAREPGGTPVGEGIRALLLDHERRPAPLTEALLMVAARAQLTATVLRPALEAGRIVLCDRFGDSTLAYQGGGRGIDHELLAGWNRAATGGLVPVLTLLFDVPVPVGLERRHGAAGAPNRLDREPAEFHERVRARYLELAKAEPGRWRVVDGTVAEDELEARVWEAVGPRLAPVRG